METSLHGKLIRVLLFVLVCAAPAAADPILLINPTPRTVNQGDTFSFDVFIEDALDLYGFQFDLTFDPTLLSAISVTEGLFLGTGGSTFFFSDYLTDPPGTVSNNVGTLLDAIPGVTGNGVLATMSFMALAAGTSNINFANVLLQDSNYFLIPTTTVSGSVTANVPTASVPEPSTLLFVSAGLAFAALQRRRRR